MIWHDETNFTTDRFTLDRPSGRIRTNPGVCLKRALGNQQLPLAHPDGRPDSVFGALRQGLLTHPVALWEMITVVSVVLDDQARQLQHCEAPAAVTD